jgi:GH15 family glucan-1,4-alpha-glucosidase
MYKKQIWLFQAAQWQDMVEKKMYQEQTSQKRKYPSSEEQFDEYVVDFYHSCFFC